ncbi:hypothetical protein [Sphingopyxis sp. MWB1]|uniref:hypothetical protein n=1 Tax=Sphingopyxis sp. MWB1 TaxID=1537715 RepID=UPI00051A72D4|nr:hypothetical protein [Sphingopyxis sp. MWB1]
MSLLIGPILGSPGGGSRPRPSEPAQPGEPSPPPPSNQAGGTGQTGETPPQNNTPPASSTPPASEDSGGTAPAGGSQGSGAASGASGSPGASGASASGSAASKPAPQGPSLAERNRAAEASARSDTNLSRLVRSEMESRDPAAAADADLSGAALSGAQIAARAMYALVAQTSAQGPRQLDLIA